MHRAEKEDVTFDDLLRDIVENQHLFKPFHIVEVVENPNTKRLRVVLVKNKNDGEGIQMPEPDCE
jgi:hypothetical protein